MNLLGHEKLRTGLPGCAYFTFFIFIFVKPSIYVHLNPINPKPMEILDALIPRKYRKEYVEWREWKMTRKKLGCLVEQSEAHVLIRLLRLALAAAQQMHNLWRWLTSFSSGFSSSLVASGAAPPAAAPPAEAAAGAAPPPDPTFKRRSLTSLPSKAYTTKPDSVSEYSSTHVLPSCRISDSGGSCLSEKSCPDGLNLLDLSSLDDGLELIGLLIAIFMSPLFHLISAYGKHTVISRPSSARMRAA